MAGRVYGYRHTEATLAKMRSHTPWNKGRPATEAERAVLKAIVHLPLSDQAKSLISQKARARYADPEYAEATWDERPVLGTCTYCGGAADTRDHVDPRTRTGATVLACITCNASKGHRTPAEWKVYLLAQREAALDRLSWIDNILTHLEEG